MCIIHNLYLINIFNVQADHIYFNITTNIFSTMVSSNFVVDSEISVVGSVTSQNKTLSRSLAYSDNYQTDTVVVTKVV